MSVSRRDVLRSDLDGFDSPRRVLGSNLDGFDRRLRVVSNGFYRCGLFGLGRLCRRHRVGGFRMVSGLSGSLTVIVSPGGLMRASMGTVCSSSLFALTASRSLSTSVSVKMTCGVRNRNSSLVDLFRCLLPKSQPRPGMRLSTGMPF